MKSTNTYLNELFSVLGSRKCGEELRSFVLKCPRNKCYEMVLEYFEESTDEDYEVLYAMTLFKKKEL